MNLARVFLPAICAVTALNANASGIDSLQKRVEQIAQENGVAAPDVRAELAGKAEQKVDQKQPDGAGQIERIVVMNTERVSAIKSKDGKIMYLFDNGRFALMGRMVDVWNRKELKTIEDIDEAVNHINLDRMGFQISEVNHFSIGSGEAHTTVFVDPQCGWCHKLIAEINNDPEMLKNYTFDFVVVPVLGNKSQTLSKKLFCAKADDTKKYQAFREGAQAIEALESVEDCKTEIFDQTKLIAKALGVESVPMIIAPDGRFQMGKPKSVKEFLAPSKPEAAEKAQATK